MTPPIARPAVCTPPADAGAFLDVALLAETIERLEKLRQLVGSQSVAGVPDTDPDAPFGARDAFDDNRSIHLVVLDRVRQQVDQDLLHPCPVGLDKIRHFHERKGDADAALLRLRPDHRPAFLHDFGQ
jgi:hypothetical protein